MSDAVPLLEVGDGRERISPLLTRRRPCSGPTMLRPGGRRRHVTAGAWARVMGRRRGGGLWPEMQVPRWAAATAGAGGAEVGARRLPELWTRRDWESTGVGWGLPPAGAVGAVVWGLHRAPAGAAGRRRRSELHAFFISTGTFF